MTRKFLWLGSLSVLLASFYFVATMQFVPKGAAQVAESFLTLLSDGNLEQAYDLTSQRGLAGSLVENSLAEFKAKLGTNFSGFKNTAQLQYVFPFQSQGNRLRRWLRGQEIEMPEITFDYTIGQVPYSLRLIYRGKGQWRVLYFGAHAG